MGAVVSSHVVISVMSPPLEMQTIAIQHQVQQSKVFVQASELPDTWRAEGAHSRRILQIFASIGTIAIGCWVTDMSERHMLDAR